MAYDSLLKGGSSDVLVFGSQAMSLYMKRALSSKDLDLIASGVTLRRIEKVAQSLEEYTGQRPKYSYFVGSYEGRKYPVFSIYLQRVGEKPFVIEVFETYLGYELRRLTPYVTFVKRGDHSFQTLCLEAIIATRLAFRPPERITAFNARRLNNFIEGNRQNIDWRLVNKFAHDFKIENVIRENLTVLLKKNNLKILGQEKLDRDMAIRL